MGKLPAFQFYPADWRKDPGVQSLSFHDRGIWFEILCLMHESEQRGRLLLNGKAMPDEALARLLGLDKQIVTKTVATLIEYGVASRAEDGALMNRRMVRDENLRAIRQNAGKLGGNPALLKQNGTTHLNQNPTTPVKQNSTPSSSSSSSSSSSKGGSGAEAHEPHPILTALEEIYPGHATNFRTMREMFDLAIKLKATTEQVRAFPVWLAEKHPKKGNSPFAFRDLFFDSLKTGATSAPVIVEAKYNCAKCKDRFVYTHNGQPVKCDCWQKEQAA